MGFLDELKGALNVAANAITKAVDKVEKPLTDKATEIASNASVYANEAANTISKAVDKVEKPLTDKATEIANEVTNEVKTHVGSVKTNPQPQTNPQTVNCTDFVDYSNSYDTDESYFDKIINSQTFPEYEIRKNVHPSTLDASAHPSCYSVTYMFCKNGEPALAVLLMNTNQYRSMCANGTYDVLNNNGIKYIRFFKGMKNEHNYVVNRICENL